MVQIGALFGRPTQFCLSSFSAGACAGSKVQCGPQQAPELAAAVDSALHSMGLAAGGAGDRPAGALSGGMRRRLSAAIAFLGEPAVVYLDEPSAVGCMWRSLLWRGRAGAGSCLPVQVCRRASRQQGAPVRACCREANLGAGWRRLSTAVAAGHGLTSLEVLFEALPKRIP